MTDGYSLLVASSAADIFTNTLLTLQFSNIYWMRMAGKNFDDKCYNQCSGETSEIEKGFDRNTDGTSARIHQKESLLRRGKMDRNESERNFEKSANFNHREMCSSSDAGRHMYSCEPIWDNISDNKTGIKTDGIVNHQESENEDHLILDMSDINSKSLRLGITSCKDHQVHRIFLMTCLAIIILVTTLLIFSLG